MQGIVITAYKDFDQLFKLVAKLLNGGFKVFVHVDKKSYTTSNTSLRMLKGMKNVYLTSNYTIEWGSINHLYAIIDLLKIVIADKDIHFVHIISSQDYPIKSMEYLKEKFTVTHKKIYMTITDSSDFDEEVRSRYEQYYFFNKCDSRNKETQNKEKWIKLIQTKLGIKRTTYGNFKALYKGMVWISTPTEVLKYILKDNKELYPFLKFLKYCRIPEEFFFQTMILNSPYRSWVVKDNLRYTLWEEKHWTY